MARLAQMGVIFVVMTLMFSSLGAAEIDPGTAVGVWLLDEGKVTRSRIFPAIEMMETSWENPNGSMVCSVKGYALMAVMTWSP